MMENHYNPIIIDLQYVHKKFLWISLTMQSYFEMPLSPESTELQACYTNFKFHQNITFYVEVY